jgi:hypothetical protein
VTFQKKKQKKKRKMCFSTIFEFELALGGIGVKWSKRHRMGFRLEFQTGFCLMLELKSTVKLKGLDLKTLLKYLKE